MDNVFIITDGSNFCGNGFIVKDGLAVTNSHVLRNNGSHYLYQGEHIKFNIIKDFGEGKSYDRNDTELYDFALISSDKFIFDSNIFLRDTKVDRLKKLSTVAYSPGSESLQRCTGFSNHSLNKTTNTGSIIFGGDCLPSKGNSGCPVIDENLYIVGLFIGLDREDSKTGYFIRMDYLLSTILK